MDNVIEVTKKTSHKTEQMELVISILCMVNNIHLSKTEIKVLAYYVVHGVKESTDTLLFKSKITKQDNLRNMKTKFTKMGFMKRTKELYNSYELNLNKDFSVADDLVNLFIKIDNS
jgi:hypothetical protein